jgi:tRNA dimethylallyltransferase
VIKAPQKKIIFIVGPTAVGKSKLAVEIARRIGGEIVSCDSMQIYRGLDILSNKPSLKERKNIPHHLIDIISPSQNFNVSKFIELSNKLICEIHKRGNIPIFVGGTGLYMDSLLNGLFQGPSEDQKVRKEFYKKAQRHGNDYLYQRLKKIDPAAAKKIHVNDLRRIVRALEVYKITAKPISMLQKQRKGILSDKRFEIVLCGLTLPREKLYKKINERVDKMFKQGVVSEVEGIIKKSCSRTFKQALGIKEINSYLSADMNLEEVKELLKRNTRRYAKRQITWFKRNINIHWIDSSHLGKHIIDEIIRAISK